MAPPSELAGRELPAGTARLEPYQNWLLHDAFYSEPGPEPHPVAAFILANRGIGISLADLFTLFGSDINDGPLLAESQIELHRPLAEDADYEVRGEITAVERRQSRRIGPFDRITCRFDLFQDGAQAATVTNVFAIPREPKGAVTAWTEERGACDERRGKAVTQGRPEASGIAEQLDHVDPARMKTLAMLTEAFPGLDERDGTRLALPDAPHLQQIVILGDRELPGFATEAGFAAAGARVPDGDLEYRRQLVKVRDPAVVMYTSGTAAEPKGALLSHEALIRFADGAKQTRFFLTPEDRIWTALPMFHIGGIAFSVATIYAGATLVHTGFYRPELALDQIASLRCTIVLAAFETIWLPVVNQPDFNDRDLSGVRIVMTVGVTERLRDMASRLPDAIQVSCFGMTEASSFLSLSYLTDTLEQRVTTGGHPMPGMECRVVDPVTGVDLPPDTEGELLFRGSNCFSGYLNDPELTAQVFDDGGWFHTMDVATMDPEGRVTFVSRLKDMLKVGGENVSAAEVESYLLRHPAISIVQVVSAPDDYYVEVPAAFIQLKPGATATEEEIVAFCAGKIATFRVPRYVRFVAEWPMSGTKIKKAILREMIAADLKEKGITQAPRIETAPAG